MGDLNDLNSSQTVKIALPDSSGGEQSYVTSATPFPVTKQGGVDTALNNAAIPTSSTLIAGSDGTNLRPVATDSQGRLITSALTGFGADFAFGTISTSALTKVAVRKTAYTEQTTNAQRSIASSSANDSAAGTGARTVSISYLTSTGAGPFTETVTLNGTSYVNTVATDICFINNIEVITVGSGLVNAGTLTLKASTAGAGATIGTVAIGDCQTLWAHHYVPSGKTLNVTGISAGHTGTTVGSGGLFTLNKRNISADAVELQVSDFFRLYGQSSSVSREYGSPITIAGPAFITLYVTPETASATTYRGAFDFFQP